MQQRRQTIPQPSPLLGNALAHLAPDRHLSGGLTVFTHATLAHFHKPVKVFNTLDFMAILLEVQCVNKSDRSEAHERIKSIGGGTGRLNWKHSQELAISWIEGGAFSYYLMRGGLAVGIIIATTSSGHKYLKTAADTDQPDSLLSLPECFGG